MGVNFDTTLEMKAIKEKDINQFSYTYLMKNEIATEVTPTTLDSIQDTHKVNKFYLFIKRVVDVVASLIGIIMLSPLFLVIALLIKVSDHGPVFYKHERVGYKGKKIYILKFRSMKNDPRKITEILNAEQLEQYYKEFKVDNDPRITKMGKFLRKTSLDELPQLFNILKGQLSIVGPRPILDEEINKYYGNNKDIYVSCKPGLTGYWQVYGRSDVTYESGKRQELELYYIKNRSFKLDLKIILNTVPAVLFRKGAK
jgi:lipopolysaccharide/colanic/teichoic acid biosynthesis glycosyltransferase